MQTERASVESVIEEKLIRELPLNGRNPVELVRLAPGMRYLGKSSFDQQHTISGLGSRDDQTGFQLDGLDSNSAYNEARTGIPNIETIAEFNVEASNFTRNMVGILSRCSS